MPIQASPFSMGPERNKPPLDGLQPILSHYQPIDGCLWNSAKDMICQCMSHEQLIKTVKLLNQAKNVYWQAVGCR